MTMIEFFDKKKRKRQGDEMHRWNAQDGIELAVQGVETVIQGK